MPSPTSPAATPLTRRLGRTLAATLAAGAAVVVLAAPVGAAETAATVPTRDGTKAAQAVDTLKKADATAIANRQTVLDGVGARLASSPACDNGGAVADIIASSKSGLANLGTTIATQTDNSDLARQSRSIYIDYRVYALVSPQAHITSACGHVTDAAARLQKVIDGLKAKVAARTTDPGDGAAATLDDAAAKVAAATSSANAAAASVAGLRPDHGDAGVAQSNTATLRSAQDQIQAARTDLADALRELRTLATS